MRRFRARKPLVGVSLFPFLAVLICTMGALIVLLVLVVQLARVDASEAARNRDFVTRPDALQQEQEDVQWRRELWEQQRTQVQQQVAEHRWELSHLEEHIRELENEWETLRRAAADVQERLQGKKLDEQDTRARLQQLQDAISAAQRDLEEARSQAARRPPLYAVIPYDGPQGTHRRPVYVECREDAIVIQPEGLTLPLRDLQGPQGPGNPLDAALRAVRQYCARTAAGGSQGEPYPLLIVRPGGIESYALARAAMRSWDDEFGYELIDDSMQLKFPDPDPALAEVLSKAVADARSRQAILAAAMPSRFVREPEVGYVASATRGGGFTPMAAAADAPLGQRRGGLGQGGDARYGHGRAPGRIDGEAARDEHTGSGPQQQGSAQGQPGASVGSGAAPLAQMRGNNWALPGANASSTGIVRPIRVALLPDRLVLLPARGEAKTPEVVLVEGPMTQEIDRFVSLLWDRIEKWGMAVAGGYWKPVLHVTVAQGADARFEEFKTLLDGSGLEIQRTHQ